MPHPSRLIRFVFLVCVGLVLRCSAHAADEVISLAGPWRFQLGGAATPPSLADPLPAAPTLALADTITLPATTATAGKGPENPERRLAGLTELYRYEGPAWFEREITIPATWRDHRITLLLERTKFTRVWLDGRPLGESPQLTAPQVYDLGDVAPGPHRLTILVDNSRRPVPGDNHQLSEHTQGNWNGLLGRLELRATPRVWIDEVRVFPDVARRSARVRLRLANTTDTTASGRLTLATSRLPLAAADPLAPPRPRPAASGAILPAPRGLDVTADAAAPTIVETDLYLGADAPLWDEFTPALHALEVTLTTGAGTHTARTRFGLREIAVQDGRFTLNGRPIFLRGKNDAGVFPLTGHPPMDAGGWRAYLRTCRAWGINHLRFHSWTPPAAAFEAADELGFYLQAELPFWGTFNDAVRTALEPEAEALLRACGNAPSFVLFALGNENRGNRETMTALVTALRESDPRRLYASGSNNFHWAPVRAAADDFWVSGRLPMPGAEKTSTLANVRGSFATNDRADGHIQLGPPGTRHDYTAALAGAEGLPVIGHEIGQFTTTPDFREIESYTGVMRARNLEHFRTKLAASGQLALADDFFRASGKLAALAYREEVEAALRTPGFGGFQLLDLQDFPGQGTALVGLLNAFLEPKGAIIAERWREFCAPQVLLARFDRYVWEAGETFSAAVQLAHYGPADFAADTLRWTLRDDASGRVLAQGRLPAPLLARGGLRDVARVSFAVPARTARCTLELSLLRAGVHTRYPLWAFAPPPLSLVSAPPAGVRLTRFLGHAALNTLKSGGRVILMPDAAHPFAHTVGGGFTTDFWCWPMFANTPGTMGLLVQAEHRALARFPTAEHSDWQWFHLAQAAQPVVLDGLPAEVRPIVQVIDNFDRVHRLGLVWEVRVGEGRLLICGLDLPTLARERPEARALLASLYAYAASPAFAPKVAITPEQARDALAARVPTTEAKLTVSSSQPNRGPERALNSNARSAWHPARDRLAGAWWQLEFAAPERVRGVVVAWAPPPGPASLPPADAAADDAAAAPGDEPAAQPSLPPPPGYVVEGATARDPATGALAGWQPLGVTESTRGAPWTRTHAVRPRELFGVRVRLLTAPAGAEVALGEVTALQAVD